MIKESILCDNCGTELITNTKYPHKFSLELQVIDTNRNSSNSKFLLSMTPPFSGTKHFCNKKCLGEWVLK